MNIKELADAVKNYKPTDEEIAAMRQRAKEAAARFEKEAWERRVTQEMLNRSYSI